MELRPTEHLPKSPFLLVANHRSFLDVPLLMAATAKPVRFACHYYMTQVPVMHSLVNALGCIPLDEPAQRGRTFLKQATTCLRSHQAIGIFPEGTGPMVNVPPPDKVGDFQRGFAHLALRSPVEGLKVVPAAVLALEENQQATIPFSIMRWFDPSEPLFERPGLHPAVIYRHVRISIGKPVPVTDMLRKAYRGRQASQATAELSERCRHEVQTLLETGCY